MIISTLDYYIWHSRLLVVPNATIRQLRASVPTSHDATNIAALKQVITVAALPIQWCRRAGHIALQTFPGQDVSRKDVSRKDVSRTSYTKEFSGT